MVSIAITKDIWDFGRYLTKLFDSEKICSGIGMNFYGPIVTATECSAFTGFWKKKKNSHNWLMFLDIKSANK